MHLNIISRKPERASAYGVEPVIFPAMAHDMMLESGWRAVADTIAGWLESRKV